MDLTATLINNIGFCLFKCNKNQINCVDETEVYLGCFILLGARIECETKYVHPKITEVSAPV